MSVTAHAPRYCTKLILFIIALLVPMTLTCNTWAAEQRDTGKYENLDTRWLPWVGSWRLVSDKVNTNEGSSKGEYFLTISPGSNENAITMKGNQDEKVLIEEEIIADGLRHPLKDEKCSGYYEYSWSENGKRLLLNSETKCPGDPPRQISGMSIMDDNRDWLDIQLLQNGVDKAVSIRKYRNIDSDVIAFGRFNPDQVRMSRIAASESFSINEIIELSSKVEPEVLEAALLEVRKPFPINSKQLLKLSDSGVNSRVVDLMVAFSFPEKFTVEQETISLAQAEGSQMNYYSKHRYNYYSYYYPILPWHWTSSSYMSYAYGYSYLGWYLGDGYYYYPLWTYYPSYYYYGGGGGGTVGERGTVIKGRGYTRTAPDSSGSSPRYAQPRNPPAVQSAPVQSSSSYSSGGSSSSYSSGSVSTSSSSSNATASPSGYSRGGR